MKKWKVRQRALGSLMGLGLLGALSSGMASCSSHTECTPPIPSGVTYRVRVAPLLPQGNSAACHVIDLSKSATPYVFELTTGQAVPSPSRPDCSMTPLQAPPVQKSIQINDCVPYEPEMLGLSCDIEYAPMCPGRMNFYFRPVAGQTVNWTAPVIQNVEFVMSDRSSGCLVGTQNCEDVYAAQLERIVN